MPLPLILGAAALASAAFGAKKGYDGYQKHSEADDIVTAAKNRYEGEKRTFDSQEKTTHKALESLGNEELEIGKQFHEFKTLADELLKKINTGRQNKLDINFPKHKLQRIESYSYTAIGVLGAAAGAGIAGAAAGFAVYGGVMALGAASTGTAISSLAGVAATNATLAAIGGGSLATGGLGMAGGTAILGAAVAGPVLAIAGWAYNSHGEEALANARKVDREINSALAKICKATAQLTKTEKTVLDILGLLKAIYARFEKYFDILKAIDAQVKAAQVLKQEPINFHQMSDTIIRAIQNGYALAEIIVDIITTPIFKVQTVNGKIMMDENGVPKMATDDDGLTILNDKLSKEGLSSLQSKADAIEPA